MTLDATLTATAYHEAGHVVLAHIAGIYVFDQDIVTTGSTYAFAPIKRDPHRCLAREADFGKLSEADYDLETAIIAAGGSEAERIYLVRAGLPVDEAAILLGAQGDVNLAEELRGKAAWPDLCRRALGYLERPLVWMLVERVAMAILRNKGVLKADSATEVLERACAEFDVPWFEILC
jgi:hypothetical protein